MSLGDINIFVGRNNSGKSTVLKALQLMKGNLNTLSNIFNRKNIFSSLTPMFVFDVDELAELHIDNFERALYNKAERKEITLSVTIEGCTFTIVLDGQNIEQNSYYVAVPYNSMELKSGDFYLSFNFQTRDLHMKFNPGKKFLLSTEVYQMMRNNQETLKEMQAERNDLISIISENEVIFRNLNSKLHSSSGQSLSSQEMIDIVSKRQRIQTSNRTYRKRLDALEKEISEMQKSKLNVSDIDISIKSLPEFTNQADVNVIQQVFKNIFEYAETDFGYDQRTKNYKSTRSNQLLIKSSMVFLQLVGKRFLDALKNYDLEYIHAHAASQKVIYLKEDKMDVLSKSLSDFCKARIIPGDKEWTFIKKWMGKDRFAIGEDFRIDEIQSAGYILKIIEDGEELNLADKGTGSIQIMTLLFSLAVIMHKASNEQYYPTILIEEPEQNLHPILQSMLADMLLDFRDTIMDNEIQLIIETHSEYLVRRTQVIAAKMDYIDDENNPELNPFTTFYFPSEKEKHPYKMIYQSDGKFKNDFGVGFFDEAENLAFAIL